MTGNTCCLLGDYNGPILPQCNPGKKIYENRITIYIKGLIKCIKFLHKYFDAVPIVGNVFLKSNTCVEP